MLAPEQPNHKSQSAGLSAGVNSVQILPSFPADGREPSNPGDQPLSDPLKILFVDNGNYSRSPAAEIIAKSMAAARGVEAKFHFASAGVIDKHVDGPADPRTVAECERRGYDLSSFSCRKATAAVFQQFDRILAMDAQNLAVFSLAHRDGDRASVSMFDLAGEVPDPFYEKDEDAFVRVIDQIEARVADIIDGN